MVADNRLSIGGNNPPSEIEGMKAEIEERNAKALKRANALIDAADRVPEKIEDQETSDKITDLESLISSCWKVLDTARETEKAPHLEKSRVVDGIFQTTLKTLTAAKARVKATQTRFLVDEANKERQRREQLAREQKEASDKAAEEAAKLEKEGKISQAEVVMTEALKADDDAAFFADAATQKGVAMAVSTGEMTGARSSLTYTWTGEIEDADSPALREALWGLIKIEEKQKALNQYVKLHKGTKPIKGAKIWEKPNATTR